MLSTAVRSLAIVACWLPVADIPAPKAATQKHDLPLNFTLAEIRFIQNFLSQAFIEETGQSWGFDPPSLTYSFVTRLPNPAIEVMDLKLDSVILASGETLLDDRVRRAGLTYKGKNVGYSRGWGLDLTPDGEHLRIKVVVDLAHIADLKEVSGSFQALRGRTEEILNTQLMKETKGFKDEYTGVTVRTTMHWGIKGRYIDVVAPMDRGKIKKVEVLDAQGKTIPYDFPHHYNLVRYPSNKETLFKLYLQKPEGSEFSLRITRYKETFVEKVSFKITNVKATNAE